MRVMVENPVVVEETGSETCLSVRPAPKLGQGVPHARMEWWDMTNSHKTNPFADDDTWSLNKAGMDCYWKHGGRTRFYVWRYRRDKGGVYKLGTRVRVRSFLVCLTRG